MFLKKCFRYFIPLLIAFAYIVTASCKKYPDGPLLNIYPKASRVEATWDVEYFSINGFDSTTYLINQSFYGFYEFSVKTEVEKMIAVYAAKYNSSFFKIGYWEFKNKKNDLHVHFDNNPGIAPASLGPYGANDITWEIRRLKINQLWLKTNYQGREFYLKLKKVNI